MAPIWEIVENYNAFEDNPWPVLFRQLDKKYPDSKFILTIREDEKWLNSVLNHFGGTSTDMRKWIYGVGDPVGNEKIYLHRYQQHNREVKEFFNTRSDDLLIMNFEEGDGWDKLCAFLNHKKPKAKFPHTHKGAFTRAEKAFQFVLKPLRITKKVSIKLFKSAYRFLFPSSTPKV